MSKFEQGDEVVCVNDTYAPRLKVGDTYTVLGYHIKGVIRVVGLRGTYEEDRFHLAKPKASKVDILKDYIRAVSNKHTPATELLDLETKLEKIL